jgi:hypothetical protein
MNYYALERDLTYHLSNSPVRLERPGSLHPVHGLHDIRSSRRIYPWTEKCI